MGPSGAITRAVQYCLITVGESVNGQPHHTVGHCVGQTRCKELSSWASKSHHSTAPIRNYYPTGANVRYLAQTELP